MKSITLFLITVLFFGCQNSKFKTLALNQESKNHSIATKSTPSKNPPPQNGTTTPIVGIEQNIDYGSKERIDSLIKDAPPNLFRKNHCSIKISDQKILIFGGVAKDAYSKDSLIYDISKNSVENLEILSGLKEFYGYYCEIKQLNKNELLITSFSESKNASFIFNMTTKKFSTTQALNYNVIKSVQISLKSGAVLKLGGFNSKNGNIKGTELFDPLTKTWKKTKEMNFSRSDFAALQINEFEVLVTGGRGDQSKQQSSSEVYNLQKNTWTVLNSMSVPRDGHSMILLKNGLILVAGGTSYSGKEVELLDLKNKTWALQQNQLGTKDNTRFIKNDRGEIFLISGYNFQNLKFELSITQFDELRNVWTRIDQVSSDRLGETIEFLNDDQFIIIGGRAINNNMDFKGPDLIYLK